jgi:hypothetical protein
VEELKTTLHISWTAVISICHPFYFEGEWTKVGLPSLFPYSPLSRISIHGDCCHGVGNTMFSLGQHVLGYWKYQRAFHK